MFIDVATALSGLKSGLFPKAMEKVPSLSSYNLHLRYLITLRNLIELQVKMVL